MGSVLSSQPQPPAERAALQNEINKLIAENPVVIFSKTWCRTCHAHRCMAMCNAHAHDPARARCGFCAKAKQIFVRLAVTPRIVELDSRGVQRPACPTVRNHSCRQHCAPSHPQFCAALPSGDGHHVQNLLADMTGQRTVPNIWVNGKHVGGGDAITAEHSSGELQKRLGKL